jgi:hypothetical protein
MRARHRNPIQPSVARLSIRLQARSTSGTAVLSSDNLASRREVGPCEDAIEALSGDAVATFRNVGDLHREG